MATKLPEELFEHILWHACAYGFALPLCQETKTAISLIGQVCCYWARMARRRLFCELVLRSADEYEQLQAFLTATSPSSLEPLSELIMSIRIELTSYHRPWLHLVASAVRFRLRNCSYFTVVINQAKYDMSTQRWRTLQEGLPRTLPGGALRLFKLVLDGVRFPDGHALFRMLSSVPSLCTLDLLRLTFATAPTTADFFAPPFGWRLGGVVSDSLLALHFVPLLVASTGCGHPAERGRRARAPMYILHPDDHRALLHLLSILEGSSAADAWAVPAVEHRRTVGRIRDRLYADGPEQTYLQVYSAEYASGRRLAPEILVHFTPDDTPGTCRLAPVTVRIDAIHISCVDALAATARAQLNGALWARFAHATRDLPCLRFVELLLPAEIGNGALGISDDAFRPLIDAGKLQTRWLEYGWSTAADRSNGTQRPTDKATALLASIATWIHMA